MNGITFHYGPRTAQYTGEIINTRTYRAATPVTQREVTRTMHLVHREQEVLPYVLVVEVADDLPVVIGNPRATLAELTALADSIQRAEASEINSLYNERINEETPSRNRQAWGF